MAARCESPGHPHPEGPAPKTSEPGPSAVSGCNVHASTAPLSTRTVPFSNGLSNLGFPSTANAYSSEVSRLSGSSSPPRSLAVGMGRRRLVRRTPELLMGRALAKLWPIQHPNLPSEPQSKHVFGVVQYLPPLFRFSFFWLSRPGMASLSQGTTKERESSTESAESTRVPSTGKRDGTGQGQPEQNAQRRKQPPRDP